MTSSAKDFGSQAARAAADLAHRVGAVARSSRVQGAAKAIAHDVATVARPATANLTQAIRDEWKHGR